MQKDIEPPISHLSAKMAFYMRNGERGYRDCGCLIRKSIYEESHSFHIDKLCQCHQSTAYAVIDIDEVITICKEQ